VRPPPHPAAPGPVPGPGPAAPVPGPGGRVRAFLEMVKFSHTVFALPFALCGLLLGSGGLPGPRVLGWVVVAMVGARTAAMAFNRLADASLDARNPRTATRALPAGTLSRGLVAAAMVASAGLFVLAAARLGPLCLALSGPTLAVLLGYSLTKRFTALCHFALGLALGIAPLGGYLAATGAFDGRWPAAATLGGAVLLWVAGFDALYACQDVEADRAAGLHSIPARLGVARALRVAAALHGGAWLALAAYGALADLGAAYAVALAVVGGLLAWQHRLVRPDDLARVNLAFFHANAAISLLVLIGTAADLLRR
jgi:4-hydroxybenzoate polyprenyltransferase